MRAIYILSILLIITLNGCTTVEIAKEVTKVGDRIKTTIQKATKNQNDLEKSEDVVKTEDVKKEKTEIIVAKKKEKAVIKKQKEIIVIKIQGKTLNQLTQNFGKSDFIREDGNTKTVRFNSSSCRLFVYFNLEVKKPKAQYYEIRNIKGELIDEKEKINKCFKEIQKT
jgi:hypothetical protein